MGCFFSTLPDIVESKSKASEVPCWATTEWENLLHANDLSMDQENFDSAKARFYEKQRIHEHNQDMFEDVKRSGEEQMMERRKVIEEEQLVLKEESSRVKIMEIKLKKKEDEFEKMRRKEEGQMGEKRRSLASEQSLLWKECGKVMLREMNLKHNEEEFAKIGRKVNREEQMSERKINLIPEGEEIHQKKKLTYIHQKVKHVKDILKREEDELEDERSNGEDVLQAEEPSLLLHQEKHEVQIKEKALTLLMENEILNKEKKILFEQQIKLKIKEDEIQTRETNLLLVILEIKRIF